MQEQLSIWTDPGECIFDPQLSKKRCAYTFCVYINLSAVQLNKMSGGREEARSVLPSIADDGTQILDIVPDPTQ